MLTYQVSKSIDTSSRLARLNSKIDEVNAKLQKHKESRYSITGIESKNVEISINDYVLRSKNRITEIRDNLNVIESIFNQMKLDAERNDNIRVNALRRFEEKVNARLDEEIEQRKELEQRLSQMIDGEYKDLKLKIAQEGRNRFDDIENIKGLLDKNMATLKTQYPTESKIRDEQDQKIQKTIAEEVVKIKEKLIEEKNTREKNEEGFLLTVKLSTDQFKNDISNEQKIREESINKLLTLAEVAADNIDTGEIE